MPVNCVPWPPWASTWPLMISELATRPWPTSADSRSIHSSDRGFVAGLGRESESDVLVQTIITLAHALRLGVTAEGIESAEQANQLQALGCTRGQGYFFARPVPAEELDFALSMPELRAA
jgi:hypothetical protein